MKSKEKLKEALFFHNPWWVEGKVSEKLALEFKRPIINKIISFFPLDRIILIKGPRRTGKTTLLYQLIDHLLKNKVNPKSLLYLSFDDIELRCDLDEIIKAFEEVTKQILKKGKRVYFFLDEVHFLEGWQFHVKKYFDKKYPITFIVTSSSASLFKKGSESMMGRTVEETLLPFNFSEFVSYKKQGDILIKIINNIPKELPYISPPDINELIPYRTELFILFEEYLNRGGFPHIFQISEPLLWRKLLREDIIEKVIYRDLVELYGIKKPAVLEKIFIYLVDASSSILSILNVSNSFKLSREYTEKYIDYLKQAYMVSTIQKYSPSIEKRLRSNDKIHIIDSGLMTACGHAETGPKVESCVNRHLIHLKPYYWKNTSEVDFVIEGEKDLIPIEVKYRESIRREDMRGLLSFMDKFKLKNGIMITKDIFWTEKIEKKNISQIPVWLFLLCF